MSKEYKYTELGSIPIEWAIERFGDVLYAIPNNTFSRDMLSDKGSFLNVHYGDVLVKFPSVLDVATTELPHIADNSFRPRNIASNGDIIMSDTAEDEVVGKVTELQNITNQRIVSGLHTIWLRPKDSKKFASGFLGYFLNCTAYHNQLKPLMQGIKVLSLSKRSIAETKIAIPLVFEQERIAEALSDVDALIAELGELIEKKRLVKQGTMQQLLTASRRLPGFSKPWVEYKLGEIGVFSKGKGISKAETTSEGLPCIRYGEIYTNHHDYIKSFVSYISQQTAMDSVALRKGQILFTASGETKEEIGKAVAFNLDLEAYAGGDIIIFTPTIQCDPIFMGYVMNTPDVNSQKSALGQGDAVVHIGAVALSTISVFIPDISEQRAIAEILTDMDNEIAELEAKREKYRAIKEGMMQQLLTGRIRLIDSTASSGTIDPSASINSDGDTPAAHTPPITYEPSTSYPQSLAAEPTILE